MYLFKIYLTALLALITLLSGCTHRPISHEESDQHHANVPEPTGQGSDRTEGDVFHRADQHIFPRPSSLEPAIAFWRKTYCVWHKSQVAIHDDRHLDVIYEIMEFSDPVMESLTQNQKDWVSSRKNYWKTRLATLETKMTSGIQPDPDDQKLLSIFRRAHGNLNALSGASERVRTQRGTKERFMRGLEIAERYDATFRKIFRDAGLPEDLAYLPHVESSFQASARSSAGAVGIWQFTRSAAERFMPATGAADQRLDPIASARGAARYLGYAYSKLGNWPSALTSYNHGINGMMRAQNQVGHDFMRIVQIYDSPKFGFASRNYYAEFLAARDIAANRGRFLASMEH